MVHVACKVTDHIHDLAELKLSEVQTMITELLIFLKLNKKQISNIQYLKYYIGKNTEKSFPTFSRMIHEPFLFVVSLSRIIFHI